MDYGALLSESVEYTREALVGNWITSLIIILCYLPFALARFVCDPKKILADGTIHWELIPWPELIVLIIAGFLLLILLFGYTVRLYRGISPPVFDNWGSLYLDGIKLLIVNILWFIPFVLLSFVLLVLLFPLVFLIGPDSIALWVGCMLAVLLVAFVPLIIAFLYSTLGSVHYARTGSIREGIRFTAINRMIRAIGWGTYILAMFILLVAVIFFGIVQSVLAHIPVAGWVIQLVLSPIILIFTARYISRVYDHGIPQETAGDIIGEGRQQVDAAL
nr:DUF4013 domain-containing protein [uncultured Methanoregula sp.]